MRNLAQSVSARSAQSVSQSVSHAQIHRLLLLVLRLLSYPEELLRTLDLVSNTWPSGVTTCGHSEHTLYTYQFNIYYNHVAGLWSWRATDKQQTALCAAWVTALCAAWVTACQTLPQFG